MYPVFYRLLLYEKEKVSRIFKIGSERYKKAHRPYFCDPDLKKVSNPAG